VKVAKQAVENLKVCKEVSIHDPSLRMPQNKFRQTSEPPVKRQLLTKGHSAVVGKGKASASKATLSAETAATATPDSAALKPPTTASRGGTSPKPAATIMPKTASTPKKASTIEEQQNAANEGKVGKSATVSQVDADLAISSDSSDAENFADVYEIGDKDSLSDVEPDSPPKVSAQEQQQEEQEEQLSVEKTLVLEILAEFRDSITISDDGEPKVTEVSEAVSAEQPIASTLTVTPAPSHVKKSESATSIDVSARKPTRPSKPHISTIKKLRTTLPEMQPIPQLSPELAQQARRHMRTVSSLHLANASVDYHTSTAQITEQFSAQYLLKPEEKYKVSRELKKMHLGQKMLALRIWSKFPMNFKTEIDRQFFLDWLESETHLIANRNSDSEDSTVELGLGVEAEGRP